MPYRILGVIPARYQSVRFPGKPLVKIGSRTMIERVYRAAVASGVFEEVIVATDDARISETVEAFGGQVEMTSPAHPNGTLRCIEVFEKRGNGFHAMINIQGDEPFVHASQLQALAKRLSSSPEPVCTLIKKLEDPGLFSSPSIVKVVTALDGRALYFSRSPIPYSRDQAENMTAWKHIGLYGFKAEILPVLKMLEETWAETAEKLEQLRWLQHGITIDTAITGYESRSVDTPEDLAWILDNMKDFMD